MNIKKIFKGFCPEEKHGNYFRSKDKKRVVVKSYGSSSYKEIWEQVLVELESGGEVGWTLYEGSSWRGDGHVWGIEKKLEE